MIFFWPLQIGLQYFWNISEIFLKYFWNISEIFLIIGDPYLLVFLDFSWFLVGMWLLSSFFFVSQPKSGKITVFPNFHFFPKKNQKSFKKKNHWYLQGKVCLGLAQAGSPDFWNMFDSFFDCLRKTVIFPDFQIFPHIFRKSDNFQ